MEFTNEIEKATAPIYKKISSVMPEIEWPTFAPYIYRINQLKKEKVNAGHTNCPYPFIVKSSIIMINYYPKKILKTIDILSLNLSNKTHYEPVF